MFRDAWCHAHSSWLSGFTNGSWGYSFRSDLIPSFQFRQTYSLFQGDPLSDTARLQALLEPDQRVVYRQPQFGNRVVHRARRWGSRRQSRRRRPTRDSPPAILSWRNRSRRGNLITGATGVAPYNSVPERRAGMADDVHIQRVPPAATGRQSVQRHPVQPGCRVRSVRKRQPGVLQPVCASSAIRRPDTNFNATTAAAPFVVVPTRHAAGVHELQHHAQVGGAVADDLRFPAHNFASQIVSLQRDLHDWRAIFSFTQSPTGSFAFSFFVALKAEPALKFNYDKQTFRSPGNEATGRRIRLSPPSQTRAGTLITQGIGVHDRGRPAAWGIESSGIQALSTLKRLVRTVRI